jgi:hypothetical protein
MWLLVSEDLPISRYINIGTAVEKLMSRKSPVIVQNYGAFGGLPLHDTLA